MEEGLEEAGQEEQQGEVEEVGEKEEEETRKHIRKSVELCIPD